MTDLLALAKKQVLLAEWFRLFTPNVDNTAECCDDTAAALREAHAKVERLKALLRKVDAACQQIPEGVEGYLEPLSDALVEVRAAIGEKPNE